MTAQELATSNTEQIPFITAILNNGYLGMVRQWQELFFDERYSGVYLDPDVPDYVKLAEAYGAVGIKVEDPAEVDTAIEKAYSVTDRSVVIDVRVDPREGVFPMVPAGGSNDDIILGPEFADHETPGEAPIV
jgi:acetolactate synthase-1/2/3 large subunit